MNHKISSQQTITALFILLLAVSIFWLQRFVTPPALRGAPSLVRDLDTVADTAAYDPYAAYAEYYRQQAETAREVYDVGQEAYDPYAAYAEYYRRQAGEAYGAGAAAYDPYAAYAEYYRRQGSARE